MSHNIHTISSHKCLPEKSFFHYLRILIISWLFKDLVVIMKEIMSWLFKDQINSGMAQFYHVQSNSKKWPKGQSRLMRMCHFPAQNDPFVLNNFFLVQTIIITFIYVLALLIVQNLKILTADPEFWGCAIFEPKMIHSPPSPPPQKFTILILIFYLLAPFIVQI